MAINISTIKPASLKSKNVATEEYVDTGIANIDVSAPIENNNDLFAQRLGYTNYAAMVAAASSGQTIINGGYVNTDLIEVGTINAGMINTDGLIADNISANEIVGKTITGGVINGARINGAVIKASYLDLNGDLEVLTNYIITVAMYNANPSLYTDAVYISADNEYRIPSLSVVREETRNQTLSSTGATFKSKIRSYNCANVGHNLKCVKIRPSVYIDGVSATINLSGHVDSIWKTSSTLQISLGSVLLATVYFKSIIVTSDDTNGNSMVSTNREVYFNGSMISSGNTALYTTRTVSGITFTISSSIISSVSISIVNGNYALVSNFTDTTKSLIEIKNSNQTSGSNIVASVNSATYINNMI